MMNKDNNPLGLTRRTFMKCCGGIAATLGLSQNASAAIAKTLESPKRAPVVWIGAQECTGCTESLLRSTHPTIDQLILQQISLEFHEVLSAAAGHQAEANLANALEEHKGKYILVVDGSIPVKDNGVYCMVAGKPVAEHILEAAKGAAAIIAIGSCSAWGGVPSIRQNPTGAVSLSEFLGDDYPVVNIPGCPPNPSNFLSTVSYVLTFGRLPKLDKLNRPTFAYGRLIHEHCERRPHFDAGRFAKQFGDEGHRNGYCLYRLGCKGPETYGNCSTLQFCDVGGGVWPVGVGHPCIGCNEKGVGFTKPIAELATVENQTPQAAKPLTDAPDGAEPNISAAALLGGAVGVGIGVTMMSVRELGKIRRSKEAESKQAGSKQTVSETESNSDHEA
ncbi:MAG: hydrogenase small subunit [Vibrio sp.]